MTPLSSFSLPPIWREGRLGLELAALLRDPVFRGEGVRDAAGQPVLLIPGFLAGDDSLALMTRWLRRTGHYTRRAGIRANVDCSTSAVDRLEERLQVMAETRGQKVAVIGQSRGGNFAKVLAVRRPDLVSGIVTLGSPQLDPLAVHPLVRAPVYAVGTLGTLRVRGLFRNSCRTGGCCEPFWADLARRVPRNVGYLSVYSRSDGIVDWRACLDEGARHLEVESSHCGMGLNAHVYRATAAALRSFRGERPAARGRAAAQAPLRSAA
ncbi:MAG: alpha/beta hydrolase [Actinobacteria bacterium]|nr:alpha/beta hydrolase [Actinomycetota bacterium]